MCLVTSVSIYLSYFIVYVCPRERGWSVVERRTPEQEVGGSKPTSAVFCPKVLPESTGNSRDAMAPSRHD